MPGSAVSVAKESESAAASPRHRGGAPGSAPPAQRTVNAVTPVPRDGPKRRCPAVPRALPPPSPANYTSQDAPYGGTEPATAALPAGLGVSGGPRRGKAIRPSLDPRAPSGPPGAGGPSAPLRSPHFPIRSPAHPQKPPLRACRGGPAAAYHGASPAGGRADPGALMGPSPPGAAAVSPRRFLLARPRSLPPLAAGEGRGRRAAAAHGAGKEGTRRTGGGTGLERGGTLGDGWGSGSANPTAARGSGAPSPGFIPSAPNATLVCTQRRPAGSKQPRAPRSPGDSVTLCAKDTRATTTLVSSPRAHSAGGKLKAVPRPPPLQDSGVTTHQSPPARHGTGRGCAGCVGRVDNARKLGWVWDMLCVPVHDGLPCTTTSLAQQLSTAHWAALHDICPLQNDAPCLTTLLV